MHKTILHHTCIFLVIISITHSKSTTRKSKDHPWWRWDQDGDTNKYGNIQYFSEFFMCIENSFSANRPTHPLVGLKIDEVIKFMGYPAETIKVHTEDGYILTIFRIPYSPKSPLDFDGKGKKKKPVFMNHGLTANGQEFLIQWGDRNLAFLLADSGYDVFLSNARGTSYSPDHVNKNIKSRDYWDFSWDDMGRKDVPAVVSKIQEITGEDKMYYVGHSMGTTNFMVAMSELPELNKNIHMAFLLTPSGFITHSSSFIRYIAPLADKAKYLEYPFLGGNVGALEKILESLHIKTPLGKLCTKIVADCLLCDNLYFLLGGYNGPQMNFTEIPYIVSVFPDLISTKSVVHYAQNMAHGTFRRFDYGKRKNLRVYGEETPKDYDLSQITAPVVMMFAENDHLCPPKDVKYTASKFGNNSIQAMVLVDSKDFTHSDYAIAKQAKELVYDKIIDFMQEYEKNKE